MKTAPLSVEEVANMLHIPPTTVDDWLADGSLEPFPVGDSDQVGRTSLIRFLVRRGEVLPSKLVQVSRLVIIDDEPPTLRGLVRLLSRSAPYLQVATASDPTSGIQLVRQIRPQAVLVDFSMPDMGGQHVCEILRGDPSVAPLRILAMSGQVSDVVIQRFRTAGADAFLAKPLDLNALLLDLNA